MVEILEFSFMQNAIIAGVLVSIICGVIGSRGVVNKRTVMAGGGAHGDGKSGVRGRGVGACGRAR